MKEIVLYTISGTLNTYSSLSRKYFWFSLGFAFVACLVTGIIAFVFCYYANQTFHNFLMKDGSENILGSPTFLFSVQEAATYTTVITFGLYAVYVQKTIEDLERKPRLSEVFQSVHPAVWQTFFVSLIIYLVVYFLSFLELFDTSGRLDSGLVGLIDPYAGSGRSPREQAFYIWLKNIVRFIKIYLPELMVFFIVLAAANKRFNFTVLKRYKKEVAAVLVLVFALNVLTDNLLIYIDKYVLSLLNIVFPDGIVVSALTISVHICLMASFYLAFACVFIYPLKLHTEKQPVIEESLADQPLTEE